MDHNEKIPYTNIGLYTVKIIYRVRHRYEPISLVYIILQKITHFHLSNFNSYEYCDEFEMDKYVTMTYAGK